MTRVRVCARCGSKPRENDLYLCTECRDNPATARELKALAASESAHNKPRAYLINTFRWHGWR